ncbi:MAG TPA: hypothetical protein EYH06_08955 [Chromatiales bacterium]|nr:hypothetical protein [Chromatiales bacterium]
MAFSFKNFRILILLLILFAVAAETWLSELRTTSWKQPLWVVIYPTNGDGSTTSQQIIDTLSLEDFTEIETFYKKEAERYGVAIEKPVSIQLSEEIKQRPPATPEHDSGPLNIALWSLKMRWWAWQNDNYEGPNPDIKLFAEYHSQGSETGHHSFGLKKGRISVARIYASKKYRAKNNVIIAHELLHTLGATDKYNLNTLQPDYPLGYAEPNKRPLFPQTKCELMAGRIPISQTEVQMPNSLKQCIVGKATAIEIRWVK